MDKRRQTPGIAALLAAFAISPVLGPSQASAGTSAQGAGRSGQQCQAIQVKRRVRRWAWVTEKRRVYGRRVVVLVHGRPVHVYRRVWRRAFTTKLVCAQTAAQLGSTSTFVPPLGSSMAGPVPAIEPPPPAPRPPLNVSPPTISGAPREGQTLSATTGTWNGLVTAFSYEWLRCDASGGNCAPIALATAWSYVLAAEDVGHAVRVAVAATNGAGRSEPATSTPTEPVSAALQPPSNTAAPTMSAAPQEGRTLTHGEGLWANEPTSEADQWLQCDASGNNCQALAGATGDAYVPVAADVGHTLEVQETASNAAGTSAPSTSAPSQVVTAIEQRPPTNISAPTTSGVAEQGQTLAASAGSWTGSPTSFSYEWLRCDSAGSGCAGIPLATGLSYSVSEADVGSTLRVSVVASNVAGSSVPAASAPSEVVPSSAQAPVNTSRPTIGGTAQAGKTLVASPGSWSNNPTTFSFRWKSCTASGGSCKAIRGANSSSVKLGEEDVGSTLRVSVVASNAAGPSTPAISAPSEVVAAAQQPPTNTSPATISGTAQQGRTLSASSGSWTGSPTGYAYEWLRCNSSGASCAAIPLATNSSYGVSEADVGGTLRVSVVASNAAGPSAPSTSAQSAVIAPAEVVHHLEYMLQDGVVSVYDMDHEFQLIKTIVVPQTKNGVRGVTVAPATHRMYVMHGGDGPVNGSGDGSVLAYDLVSEKVLWDVKLSTGIDSGQVSPDGTKLYIPTGENSPSGIWNVLSAANGNVIGTIQGGSFAHNTLVSNDGRYVYLGAHGSNYLDVYETETGKVKQLGPLIDTVRPLTANGSNTLAFTTASNFDGFQISSVTTGNVLFTTSFGEFPKGFPFTTASHGIGLSPDEKQAYAIDAVHKEVQIWDISRVNEGVAPTQVTVVPVSGLTGSESLCAYDCGRAGWLQVSRDGHYLFVGDSGEVIETATDKVVTTLSTLAQTQVSIEVDWQNGLPIATSGRTGVGHVP